MKVPVVLKPSKDGGFAVHVPSLPGCHTQGETVDEALDNARDAIRAHLAATRRVAHHMKRSGSRVYQVEVSA